MLKGTRWRIRRGTEVALTNIVDRIRPVAAPDGIPVPPRAMRDMVRVGDHSAQTFLEQGRAVADALRAVAQKAGRPIEGDHRLFEWGCGCGRVVRHLAGSVGHLGGCDVDPELLAWTQNNIDQANYFVSGYLPPLPLDRDSFDLVYSISVFTHIDQAAGDAWMAELARITRPSGLVIVSVLSNEDVGSFHVRRRGDGGIKRSWLGQAGAPTAYMDTYVDVPWLINRWADKVDLAAHVPKAIRGKQDLLAFRPKER